MNLFLNKDGAGVWGGRVYEKILSIALTEWKEMYSTTWEKTNHNVKDINESVPLQCAK